MNLLNSFIRHVKSIVYLQPNIPHMTHDSSFLTVREEAEPPDLYGGPAGGVRGRRGVRGRGVETEPGGPVHVRVVLLVQDQLLTLYFIILQ